MSDSSGQIIQIHSVTENILRECYWVANLTRPNNAYDIYFMLADEINLKHHILMAYYLREQVWGFIKGHIVTGTKVGAPEARIDWLFVDPSFHRRGIGARLIEAYEAHCRNAGVRRVLAQPAPTIQAKNFYAKHGYGPCGTTYTHAKELQR